MLSPIIPREALSEQTNRIIVAFGRWFHSTQVSEINIEDFKTYFFNFHNYDDMEVRSFYSKLLNQCKEEPEQGTEETLAIKLIELGFATRLSNLANDWERGEEIDIVQEVGLLHEQTMEKLKRETHDVHICDDIEEYVSDDANTIGLRFGVRILRENIRPLRSGDFVIAAGRPDVGKTSFIASQLRHLNDGISDGRPILWLNNEGTGDRILKRIYQSVLGATTDDLIEKVRQETIRSEFQCALGGTNPIRVIDCHGWSSRDVEKAVMQYNPGLVIFDMIDNIIFPTTRNDSRTDQVLEQMYQWARTLGVKYDFPVIATSQVSAEAEQQADTRCFPQQHMLKDSKTGKQGAADLIIMIGKSPEIGMDDSRFISTPKNKLARTRSYLKAEVQFDAQKALYL